MGIFSSIYDYVTKQFALRSISKKPLYVEILKYTSKAFNEGVMLQVEQKNKEIIANEIVMIISEIDSSNDPIKVMRNHLVESVIEFTKYQVLIFDKNDQKTDPAKLLETEGISGELKANVAEIIKKDPQFVEIMHGLSNPENAKEEKDNALNFVTFKYLRSNLIMQSLNKARIHLGDCNPIPDKDWFLALVHSQCVWHEEEYRKLIGMESLLVSDLGAVMYSTFMNSVISGAKYPDLAFKEHWAESISSGDISPPNFYNI